jgi:DNA-binding MarR family transcriptional regulator
MRRKQSPSLESMSQAAGRGGITGRVHPALRQYLGYALFKTALRMKMKMADLICPYGIIPAQTGIIMILKESGPMNQMTLGESMGVDKATMVKLIDGLEGQKLIKRTVPPEDRRAKLISITEKGLKVQAAVEEKSKQAEAEFLAPLNAAEKKAFKLILDKLLGGS